MDSETMSEMIREEIEEEDKEKKQITAAFVIKTTIPTYRDLLSFLRSYANVRLVETKTSSKFLIIEETEYPEWYLRRNKER